MVIYSLLLRLYIYMCVYIRVYVCVYREKVPLWKGAYKNQGVENTLPVSFSFFTVCAHRTVVVNIIFFLLSSSARIFFPPCLLNSIFLSFIHSKSPLGSTVVKSWQAWSVNGCHAIASLVTRSTWPPERRRPVRLVASMFPKMLTCKKLIYEESLLQWGM